MACLKLRPLLQGWAAYYRMSETTGIFKELDHWLRRKLRAIAWRQWKKPKTRIRKMIEAGVERARAITSGTNGRGPWWNSGASHMNQAMPNQTLQDWSLMSLFEEHQRQSRAH